MYKACPPEAPHGRGCSRSHRCRAAEPDHGRGQDRGSRLEGADRAVVLAGLAGLSALTWAYPPHPWPGGCHIGTWPWRCLTCRSGGHGGPPDLRHVGRDDGGHDDPSAAPMILTFATLNRRRQAQRGHSCPPGSSCWSYLLVWSAFSVVATGVQWACLPPLLSHDGQHGVSVGRPPPVGRGDVSVDAAQVHLSD